MNIKQAIEAPVNINNIHESCYRSHHVLKCVMEMLDRKDSHETIKDFIEFSYTMPTKDQIIN